MYLIENLQKYAKNNNGKCLSIIYKTNDAIYDWECENGHKFTKTWTNLIKNSTFCTECKNIEYIKKYNSFLFINF